MLELPPCLYRATSGLEPNLIWQLSFLSRAVAAPMRAYAPIPSPNPWLRLKCSSEMWTIRNKNRFIWLYKSLEHLQVNSKYSVHIDLHIKNSGDTSTEDLSDLDTLPVDATTDIISSPHQSMFEQFDQRTYPSGAVEHPDPLRVNCEPLLHWSWPPPEM